MAQTDHLSANDWLTRLTLERQNAATDLTEDATWHPAVTSPVKREMFAGVSDQCGLTAPIEPSGHLPRPRVPQIQDVPIANLTNHLRHLAPHRSMDFCGGVPREVNQGVTPCRVVAMRAIG